MWNYKQKTYKHAYDIACRDVLAASIENQLARAGLMFTLHNKIYTINIPFFNEIITLTLPEFSFKSSKTSSVTLVNKIIMLHYILHASGTPTGGEKIPYEDIPGGRNYAPIFSNRVIKPLIAAFGYNAYAFLEAGLSMGGKKEEYGNISFTLHAFPRIPITFILWEGDEEFSPSLNILFDPSIHTYLPFEDIVVVSKLASTRILKTARQEYNEE